MIEIELTWNLGDRLSDRQPTSPARISWSPPILSWGLIHSTWLINAERLFHSLQADSLGPVVISPIVNHLPCLWRVKLGCIPRWRMHCSQELRKDLRGWLSWLWINRSGCRRYTKNGCILIDVCACVCMYVLMRLSGREIGFCLFSYFTMKWDKVVENTSAVTWIVLTVWGHFRGSMLPPNCGTPVLSSGEF